jgi:hypothetical protein
MEGVDGAAVVDPGKSGQSRLVEIIASGEMPKGNRKVPPAELTVLSKWIDQGARFDGGDPGQPLAKLAAGAKPAPPATPTPPTGLPVPASSTTPATGPVAFSTHVAPVLATQCVKCHGGRQPRNRFSVETFAELMRGGRGGKAVLPGSAAASLLIQKLKGTAKDGQRMPLDADPLPAAQIAAIEEWITAGAKFDGPNATRPLAEVIALGAARGATHDELSRQRSVVAAKNWALAIPDDPPRTATTDNFLVIGNVPQPRLDEVAAEAERASGSIRTALALPAGKPLVHGKLTLYAFAHRYDYTEFALMVEHRSRVPTGQVGHWQYTIADAYALVVVPEERKPSAIADTTPVKPANVLTSLLVQQIGAATVASRWPVPTWLAEGLGRAIAADAAPTDPRIATWNEKLKQARGENPSVDDWLAGKLPPEEADALGYGLARQLLASGTRLKMLSAGLERKQPLDEALRRSHGRTLVELAAGWLSAPGPKHAPKKSSKS